MINPKSCAGILLRSFDTPEEALRFAERMVERCGNTGYTAHLPMAMEYREAAVQLTELVKERGGP